MSSGTPSLLSRDSLKFLSIVLPFYNEEEMIPLLKERIAHILGELPCDAEIICINDGSSDDTLRLLREWSLEDARIKLVSLSRNFGHQIAVTAGIDHTFANADAVVIMDSDLQDPPDLILQMIDKWKQGFDVVYAQRISREGETWFKKITARLFYRLMSTLVDRNLPPDTGDYRLMSRAAVHALGNMRERHRFLRGMVTWMGFHQTGVRFHRPARLAGESKYPLRKMLAFAWTAAVSFSPLPLHLILVGGLIAMAFGVLYAIYSVIIWFLGYAVPGWTAIICLQVILSGSILLGLGLVGEYISRIYEEIKRRPLYFVGETRNLERISELLSPNTGPRDWRGNI